jgi:hypothetical protein
VIKKVSRLSCFSFALLLFHFIHDLTTLNVNRLQAVEKIAEHPGVITEGKALIESQVAVGGVRADQLVPLQRYYHPWNGDHFYTTNWGEIGWGRWGYRYEGVASYVFPFRAPGTVPLHRWFNPYLGDHFYQTKVPRGWDWTIQTPGMGWWSWGHGRHWHGQGWRYEGIQCYVYPDQKPGTMPMYRMWNGRDHFYTADYNEHRRAIGWYGREGVSFFSFPRKSIPGPPAPAPAAPKRALDWLEQRNINIPQPVCPIGQDHCYKRTLRKAKRMCARSRACIGVVKVPGRGYEPRGALNGVKREEAPGITAWFGDAVSGPVARARRVVRTTVRLQDAVVRAERAKRVKKALAQGLPEPVFETTKQAMIDLSKVVNVDSRTPMFFGRYAWETVPIVSFGKKTINNVKFNLVDPRQNGANALQFRGLYPGSLAWTRPRKVSIPVNKRMTKFHILGLVGTWDFPYTGRRAAMKVTVNFLGGAAAPEVFLLENGRDILTLNWARLQKAKAKQMLCKECSIATGLDSQNTDMVVKPIVLQESAVPVSNIVFECLSIPVSVSPIIYAITAEVPVGPPAHLDPAVVSGVAEATKRLQKAGRRPKTPVEFKVNQLYGDKGGDIISIYRYLGSNGEHMYTSDKTELGTPKLLAAARYGYKYEGKGFYLARDMIKGFTPLFRYFNDKLGDHFYTTNVEGKGAMQVPGGPYIGEPYKFEGIIGYCSPKLAPGTSPLHRFFNGRDHFYTINAGEIGVTEIGKTGKYGYKYEGVQCYVYSLTTLQSLASLKAAKSKKPKCKKFKTVCRLRCKKVFDLVKMKRVCEKKPATNSTQVQRPKKSKKAKKCKKGSSKRCKCKKECVRKAKPSAGGKKMSTMSKREAKRIGVEKTPTYKKIKTGAVRGFITGAVAGDRVVKASFKGRSLFKSKNFKFTNTISEQSKPDDVLTFTVDNDMGKQAALFASFVINNREHVTRPRNGWRCSPKVVKGWKLKAFDDQKWKVPQIIAKAGNYPYGWGVDLRTVGKRAAWIGLRGESFMTCRYHLGYSVSVKVVGLEAEGLLKVKLGEEELVFDSSGRKPFKAMVFRGDFSNFKITSQPPGYYCRRFAALEKASSATIRIGCRKGLKNVVTQALTGAFTGDSKAVLSVDGVKVMTAKKWNTAYFLKGVRVSAGSVLTAVLTNGMVRKGSDKVRGFLASLRLKGRTLRSGRQWVCTQEKPAFGWKLNTFDDSAWSPAKVVGEQGDYPWYTINGVAAGAKWIWGQKTGKSQAAQKSWCRLSLGHRVTIEVEGLEGELRFSKAAENLAVYKDGSYTLNNFVYRFAVKDPVKLSPAGQKCFTVAHKIVGQKHTISVKCFGERSKKAALLEAQAKAAREAKRKLRAAQAAKVATAPLAKGSVELPDGIDPTVPTVAPKPKLPKLDAKVVANAAVVASKIGVAEPAAAVAIAKILGAVGKDGDVGTVGPKGGLGKLGHQGAQGSVGARGIQGEAGDAGPRGEPGQRGPDGPNGPTGSAGPNGPAGPRGVTGGVGPVGPAGPAGATGIRGPRGGFGPAGPAGIPGPEGVQGPEGPVGPDGPLGPVGPQGLTGREGKRGVRGPEGEGYENFPLIRSDIRSLTKQVNDMNSNLLSLHNQLVAARRAKGELSPELDSLAQKVAFLLVKKTETDSKIAALGDRIEQTVHATRELQLTNPSTAARAMVVKAVPTAPAPATRFTNVADAVAGVVPKFAGVNPSKGGARSLPLQAVPGSIVNSKGQVVQPDGSLLLVNGNPVVAPQGSKVSADGTVVSPAGNALPAVAKQPEVKYVRPAPRNAAEAEMAQYQAQFDALNPYAAIAMVNNYPPKTPGGPVITRVTPLLIPKDEN